MFDGGLVVVVVAILKEGKTRLKIHSHTLVLSFQCNLYSKVETLKAEKEIYRSALVISLKCLPSLNLHILLTTIDVMGTHFTAQVQRED